MSKSLNKPIMLSSPAPLDDGGRKFNFIYVICIAVFFLMFLFSGMSDLFGCIVVGLLCGYGAGWLIKYCIVNYKIHHLRDMQFQLNYKVPYNTLIQGLIQSLTPLGMTVEMNTDGAPVITYKNIIYDVNYKEDSNSFTIWWSLSILRAFLIPMRGMSISSYRKVVVAMGIIGYNVQQICNSQVSEPKNNESNSLSKSNDTASFCANCGAKLAPGAVFCSECGKKIK